MTPGAARAAELTVVIPTIGRPLLEGCLTSLVTGEVWPGEVIVVDQGRNCDVERWISELSARGLAVRHLRSSETGIASATNRGLEQVRTRHAAVTHDDCRVRPDWVARMACRVADIPAGLVTGRVEVEGTGIVPTTITSRQPVVYTAPRRDGEVLFAPNMGFPISLVDRVGPLDEHPSLRWAGEDNEWAYRVLRAGGSVVYDPTIVVGHLAWRSDDELPALYERYARGQGAFYGKYLRQGDLFLARRALLDLARGPWRLLRGRITHDAQLAAMGRGAVRGLAPGLVAGLRR